MSSLNVIALISGGKDSLFSILHCLAAGHKIVALANLHPPLSNSDSSNGENKEQEEEEPEGDDLNSHMYQTVGYSIIPFYESALHIPLFRQEILGSAVNTERDYSAPQDGQEQDEAESMTLLLNKVKNAIPEANAISTGAILSTYQRTRVESVALRLGLTPLSYLWQYPNLPPYSQSGLLDDMAAVGQDARIIKVASGGLDEAFLWSNVTDPKTIARLRRAMARFGEPGNGVILGEGGEFETLVIDGPWPLWKRRIEIEQDGVVLGEGGNATFRGKNARLVEKEETDQEDSIVNDLRIPDLWDDEFKTVFDGLSSATKGPKDSDSRSQATSTLLQPAVRRLRSMGTTPRTVTISNLSAPDLGSPTAQMQSIIQSLSTILSQHDLASANISHVTLLLRRISDFASMNSIYNSIFTTPNPPSRVTVSCGPTMPDGVDVMLSAIVSKPLPSPDNSAQIDRKGLHVQSRSYWAPANIGPYSQAISISLPTTNNASSLPTSSKQTEIVYIAGQIPLVPASMEIYQGSFVGQTVLSLQHLWRIGRSVNVRWWTAGVAYLSSPSSASQQPSQLDPDIDKRVRLAQAAWNSIVCASFPTISESPSSEDDEEEDIDPWDLQNRLSEPQVSDKTNIPLIPDPSAIVSGGKKRLPPCFVVEVDALPRDVDIEWHSTGITGSSVFTPLENVTRIEDAETSFFHLAIPFSNDGGVHLLRESFAELRRLLGGSARWEHSTLYASSKLEVEGTTNDSEEGLQSTQWVPCKRVWGADGQEVLGVLVGRVTSC